MRMSEDQFNEIFGKSVFRDEQTLDHSFVPEKLPHRETELGQLINDFRPLAAREENLSNLSINVLVTGKGGVGKTATVKFFGRGFVSSVRRKGIRVFFEHFNCLNNRTKSSIFRDLLSKYCYQTGKGYSDDETIKQLESFLRRERAHMILALDEVHMLSPDDIQAIVNLNEILGPDHSRFSTILVSRPMDWARVRNERIESRIQDKMRFEPYDHDQLTDIMTYRRRLAFKAGVVSDDVLDLVVTVCTETQDARHGVDILFLAGKTANGKGLDHITSEIVRLVKDRVHSTFRAEALDQFKSHELLAALGIARTLRFTEEAFVLVDDAYQEYQAACEEHDKRPHTVTSFRKYVRNLDRFKIISSRTVQAEKSKRGRHSQITLTDITAEKLEEYIERILQTAS